MKSFALLLGLLGLCCASDDVPSLLELVSFKQGSVTWRTAKTDAQKGVCEDLPAELQQSESISLPFSVMENRENEYCGRCVRLVVGDRQAYAVITGRATANQADFDLVVTQDVFEKLSDNMNEKLYSKWLIVDCPKSLADKVTKAIFKEKNGGSSIKSAL